MKEDGHIEQGPGYLLVDCAPNGDGREVSQLYRDFAVACVTRQASRVLLKAIDCSAEGHRALRDAITAMILAGIPGGLRLALVSNIAGIRAQFFDLQRDLWRLDIHCALFDAEGEAVQWLEAKAAPRADAPHGAIRPQA